MKRQIAGQWRPIIQAIVTPPFQSSRPKASVGVTFPPKLEARLIDSSQTLPSYSLKDTLKSNKACTMLEVQPPSGPELQSSAGLELQHKSGPEKHKSGPELQLPSGPELEKNSAKDEHRKLIAKIPETVLAQLRSTCEAKAEVSLLGRIHGKHPGLKALTAWARDTLHSSLSILSLKTNNLFEVTFTHPEGRIHALTQADLICDTAAIFFSSWRPHFDAKASQAEESLDHPVWVQIVDLCQVLREESFLRIVGEQIGQVISIDNSEGYRSKLFGPRIRLLVKELNRLPQTVVLPRLDREGTVEYSLEYSGLPHQCGRCRAHDHLVRNCPKKAPPVRKKEVFDAKIVESRRGGKIKKPEGVTSAEKGDVTREKVWLPEMSAKDGGNTYSVNNRMQDRHLKQEEVNWVPVNRSHTGGGRQRSVSSPSPYLQGIREESAACSQGMKEQSTALLKEVLDTSTNRAKDSIPVKQSPVVALEEALHTPTNRAEDSIPVKQSPVVGSMGGRDQRSLASPSSPSPSLQTKKEDLIAQTHELEATKGKENVTLLEGSINIS